MIPALMAARPLIKYGVLVGVPIAICVAVYMWGYSRGDANGEERILAQWDAANAQLAKEANKQLLDVRAMEAQLADEKAKNEQIVAQQNALIKRKVMEYAKSHPAVPLSLQFRSVYDDLRRMSNETGNHLTTADSRPGGEEIPRGEIRTPAAGVVSTPDAEDDTITTDTLYQAVVHTYEILGMCKSDYEDFSKWNDGREAIELKRLVQE